MTATIDATSLETHYPHPEQLDFNKMLQNETWLNAGPYPKMTYKAEKIEMTGPDTAMIHGVLTLRGVSKPVALNARFNGGWRGIPQHPQARIGFSAQGSLKRSDFGMGFGIPAPGTNMGVSDKVDIILEAEFTGPAMPDKAADE